MESYKRVKDICQHVLCYPTLADILLSEAWIQVVRNPTGTVTAVIGLWLAFIIVQIPEIILAYILNSFLATILYVIGLVYFGRWLAKCIAFPGSTGSYQYQLTRDYFKRMLDSMAKVSIDSETLSKRIKENINGYLEPEQCERIRILASGLMNRETLLKDYCHALRLAPKHELLQSLNLIETTALNEFTAALIAAEEALVDAKDLFRDAALCPEVPPTAERCNLLTHVEETMKKLEKFGEIFNTKVLKKKIQPNEDIS